MGGVRTMIRAYALVLLLLAPGAVLWAKEPAWVKVRSEHFEVLSAESEKKARNVAEHLERVRKAFTLLTKVTPTPAEPIRVLLFRNETEYRPYAPDQHSSGYYMSARGRDHIVIADDDNRTQQVLNHEYFHLFSRHAGFSLPLWLEEGLADLFSTLEITPKRVEVGRAVDNHIHFLNSMQGRPVPVAEIFRIHTGNRHHGDRNAVGRLYAQSWALAHMTYQTPEMAPKWPAFFAKIRDGATDTETVYREVYGFSAKDLDQRLADYIQRRSFYFGIVPAEGLNAVAPAEVLPAEEWEAPLLLADMLAFTRKHAEAQARYDALSAQYPDRPEINESMAYLALYEGKREEAASRFREAVRKQSRSAMTYFQLATLACNYTERNEECREWVDTSLRLNPADKKARQWAVGYALNTGDFQRAVDYLRSSGPVSAADAPEVFYRLAYAQYQLRNYREARAAIQRGQEYAKLPADIQKFSELVRYVARAEQLDAEGQTSPALPAPGGQPTARQGVPPSEEIAATAIPEGIGEQRPLLQRRGARPRSPAQSDGDRVVEQFLEQDGARMQIGILQAMECNDVWPVLLVKAKETTLRLVIDRPKAIVVLRESELDPEHQFQCGNQPASPVLAGYLTDAAPEGVDGFLRILSFQ